MIKIGQIEIDSVIHTFSYERDMSSVNLKYMVRDFATDITIWRDFDNEWKQEAKGNAPLNEETLNKVITEILSNP